MQIDSDRRPIPPQIRELAEQYGIPVIKNLGTGVVRDVESGAKVLLASAEPARTLRNDPPPPPSPTE